MWKKIRSLITKNPSIRKVHNDIYAIKLKDGRYRFVHIPCDEETAFSYSRGLQHICQLGNNKVTVDEEKISQKDKEWMNKKSNEKPKEVENDNS